MTAEDVAYCAPELGMLVTTWWRGGVGKGRGGKGKDVLVGGLRG